jgi:hypothetical protein
MKTKIILSLAIAITAALAAQPTAAISTADQVIITENSSTSLTVTLNGNDITATAVSNRGPDAWTVTLPSTVSFDANSIGWLEPENSNLANQIDFTPQVNSLFISSEFVVIPGGNFTYYNNGDNVPVGATFFEFKDNAATAETSGVPDTGSTFGLLFLSLTALFGASRLRAFRLA